MFEIIIEILFLMFFALIAIMLIVSGHWVVGSFFLLPTLTIMRSILDDHHF